MHEVMSRLASGTMWLCLIGGVMGGLFAGAMPGLSATMGVALLIGVYCGSIYGGSITAILIRTPGTPASASSTATTSRRGLPRKTGRNCGV